jgi:hypothetical protein
MPRASKQKLLKEIEELLDAPTACPPSRRSTIISFCKKCSTEELVKIIVQLQINQEAMMNKLTPQISDLIELNRSLEALTEKYEIQL